MKKYLKHALNYLMTFTFLYSQIVFASGYGPSLQNKSASAKDCPEGTEYKIKNKGVWGCYPKDAAEMDPSCDENFFETFNSKQSCLLNSDSYACTLLAVGSSVGAGAASGFAAKMFESVVNKQAPAVQKKFFEAIKEIRTERAMAVKTWDRLGQNRDKRVAEMTNGKYKTAAEMREAWRRWRDDKSLRPLKEVLAKTSLEPAA